ncbi:hypothetical protein [Sinorhizobium kostiense]|nr:hypothetical protein [Sinorhizobium kostiense]
MKILNIVFILAASLLPWPVQANTSCDRLDRYLQEQYPTSYAQRRHGVLWEGWDNYRPDFPGCTLSYKEYYGLLNNGASKKAKTTARKEIGYGTPAATGPVEKANVDPNPGWADKTKERILTGKHGEEIFVNQNPNRFAPYGSSDCAEIKPAANRGKLDWDWVVVRNKCSYPIKVLTCYYDTGHDDDCSLASNRWGLSSVIKPGGTENSVATSQKWPWHVKVIVCDVREKKNLLCVRPKSKS